MPKNKRALLIGINYRGTSSELRGCINDVNNVKEFLLTKGYKEKCITILTDDTEVKPFRNNILKYFLELILSGDKTLYFHYSGHGGYTTDLSGDESDGRDETLVPLDYRENGDILDDEIRGLLQCLNKKQHLTAVLDCCHSGSGMDLRWNLYERFGGTRLRMISDANYCDTRGQVIMLSGCLDTQTSADAHIGGKFQGAMTHAFLTCYPKAKNYQDLIQKIRNLVRKEKYTQIPNLTTGKELNLLDHVRL